MFAKLKRRCVAFSELDVFDELTGQIRALFKDILPKYPERIERDPLTTGGMPGLRKIDIQSWVLMDRTKMQKSSF